MTATARKKLEAQLIVDVEAALPQMKQMVASEVDTILMTTHAFATDYSVDEYLLLGKAIKYIALKGKNITVIA
jgi:hypothetical protein